jgi:hypothetical protein
VFVVARHLSIQIKLRITLCTHAHLSRHVASARRWNQCSVAGASHCETAARFKRTQGLIHTSLSVLDRNDRIDVKRKEQQNTKNEGGCGTSKRSGSRLSQNYVTQTRSERQERASQNPSHKRLESSFRTTRRSTEGAARGARTPCATSKGR